MTRRRRVGVNLAWLRPGVVGGSEEATVEALLAVRPMLAPAGIDVVLVCHPELATAHPHLAEAYECVELRAAGGGVVRRVVAENLLIGPLARRRRLDLVHHAGGVIPPAHRGPATLTIHDLQPLDLPDNFDAVKRRYLGALLGPSARRARQVAVPSAFVRDGVIDRLGADPARVHVVPWTVTPPPAGGPGATCPDGVGQRYLLYPAITHPHKNHAVLLDAFARVVAHDSEGEEPVELVLTGAAGAAEDAVRARIAGADLRGRVHRLDRVPVAQLEALYAGALAVVFPSAYEGFGLPVLEAMVRHRPVIVSDAGSLPEVVGDAFTCVGAHDVAAWADAMQAVCANPQLRRTLAAAGAEAASRFGPERTGAALLDVWTRALHESP